MVHRIPEGEMRDWIVSIEEAAIEHGPGATPEDWIEAERILGPQGPEELRELYAAMDGARLLGGVELFPLHGETGHAVVAPGASRAPGLPATEVWLFGRRDEEDLFAIRKRRIEEIEQPDVCTAPPWLDDVADDAWIYLSQGASTGEVRLYRTLPELVTELLSDRELGEAGRLSRARRRLESTLKELAESASNNVEKFVAAVSKGMRGKNARGKKPATRHSSGKRSAGTKRKSDATSRGRSPPRRSGR
jgi:hypothetical protein